MILCNSNFSGGDKNNNEYDFISINFLQNSYAIESDEKDKEDASENNNKEGKSIFNFVAVGDWDCTSETEDTVDNESSKKRQIKEILKEMKDEEEEEEGEKHQPLSVRVIKILVFYLAIGFLGWNFLLLPPPLLFPHLISLSLI